MYNFYSSGVNIMAQAVLQIKHWGNSLGVRLPAAIAKLLNLHANQQVKLSVEADSIIITPVKESLNDKLARFNPERHGGEVMTSASALGAERI
jgi:antitoxin MazE